MDSLFQTSGLILGLVILAHIINSVIENDREKINPRIRLVLLVFGVLGALGITIAVLGLIF